MGYSNKTDNKTTLNFSINLSKFSTSAHLQFKTFAFPRAENILDQWHMGSMGLGKETIDFGDSGYKLDPEKWEQAQKFYSKPTWINSQLGL